ncbi:sensor histidine kinase [Nocardia sp. 004]|uniref:sensor histidine kinase n=1 Tax=Nocardia sp. 004 TaxID=3385978 RepID=UPI0039A05D83
MTDRSSAGVDWGIALIVAVVQVVGGTFANTRQTGVHSLDTIGYLLLLAGPVALLLRRVWPLPVLLVVSAGCLVFFLRDYGYGPIFVSLIVAFVTAASSRSRWWTYPLVPLGCLALVWPLPSLLGRPTELGQIVVLSACSAVLLSVTEALRQRKAALIAQEQHAEAVRRGERAQQEWRAGTERLVLARDLHHMLAHRLSIIDMQSSTALELLDKRPERAQTVLTAIRTSSRDALTEIRTLLHRISSDTVPMPDDPTDTADTAGRGHTGSDPQRPRISPATARDTPQNSGSGRATAKPAAAQPPPAPPTPAPSIGDLEELVQRLGTTGLTVDTRVLGTPQQLPNVIDTAAARIIQESLTNVLRHAPGAAATVAVRYTADSVDITIDNTRPTTVPSRSENNGGNGIISMRERAHALGGALTAGPRPSGGFRVAARLPTLVPEPGAAEPDTATTATTPSPNHP